MQNPKHFLGTAFLLLTLLEVNAQQAKDSMINNIEQSIKASVNNTIGATINNVKKISPPTISADSIENELKSQGRAMVTEAIAPLTGIGNDLRQQFTPKAVIFQKGKLISNSKVELNVDYSNSQDIEGDSIGIYEGNKLRYSLSSGVSVKNMPFNFEFSGNENEVLNYKPTQGDLGKFNFDHKAYVDKIKNSITEKVNPDVLAAATVNRINAIKTDYQKKLLSEIKDIQGNLSTEKALNLPADITNLDVKDVASLKRKIITEEDEQKYRNSLELVNQLGKEKDLTDNKKALYETAKKEIGRYEKLGAVYEKVIAAKERFSNNKIVKELQSQLPFSKGNFASYLNKPGNLENVAKQYTNLSGLQQLFLNLTKFDIGQNALQGNKLDVNNVINTGINTEFTNKNISLGFILGKNNTFNPYMQNGITQTVNTEYSQLTGIKIGSGTASSFSKSLSLNTYSFKADNYNVGTNGMGAPAYLQTAPHKDAVLSLHTSYPIAANQVVEVELSKSFGMYSNAQTVNIDKKQPGSLADGLGGSNGNSNYAAAVSYGGEILKSEVAVGFKTVGLGYNNPGTNFLRRGDNMASLSVARKFYKNKITVKYKGEYHNQHFDPSKNYNNKLFANKLQVGLKVNRNTRLKASLYNNTSSMEMYSKPSLKSNFWGTSMDGTYRLKIRRFKVMNTTMFGIDRASFPSFTDGTYSNNSFSLAHTSSFAMKNKIVSAIVMASHSSNTEYYFNTSMFTSEANYTIQVTTAINIGGSLGYYANTGWNKQVGIKGQLNGTLLKKIIIGFESGYKKAIEITRPEMANQFYLNANVHYNL